jgi:hypothetical protein
MKKLTSLFFASAIMVLSQSCGKGSGIRGNKQYQYSGKIGNDYYEFKPDLKDYLFSSATGNYSFNTFILKKSDSTTIICYDLIPNHSKEKPIEFEKIEINGKEFSYRKKEDRKFIEKTNKKFNDIWGPNLIKKHKEEKAKKEHEKYLERNKLLEKI